MSGATSDSAMEPKLLGHGERTPPAASSAVPPVARRWLQACQGSTRANVSQPRVLHWCVRLKPATSGTTDQCDPPG
eukprot:5744020-Heterocapsa_arctica.AAC.1